MNKENTGSQTEKFRQLLAFFEDKTTDEANTASTSRTSPSNTSSLSPRSADETPSAEPKSLAPRTTEPKCVENKTTSEANTASTSRTSPSNTSSSSPCSADDTSSAEPKCLASNAVPQAPADKPANRVASPASELPAETNSLDSALVTLAATPECPTLSSTDKAATESPQRTGPRSTGAAPVQTPECAAPRSSGDAPTAKPDSTGAPSIGLSRVRRFTRKMKRLGKSLSSKLRRKLCKRRSPPRNDTPVQEAPTTKPVNETVDSPGVELKIVEAPRKKTTTLSQTKSLTVVSSTASQASSSSPSSAGVQKALSLTRDGSALSEDKGDGPGSATRKQDHSRPTTLAEFRRVFSMSSAVSGHSEVNLDEAVLNIWVDDGSESSLDLVTRSVRFCAAGAAIERLFPQPRAGQGSVFGITYRPASSSRLQWSARA